MSKPWNRFPTDWSNWDDNMNVDKIEEASNTKTKQRTPTLTIVQKKRKKSWFPLLKHARLEHMTYKRASDTSSQKTPHPHSYQVDQQNTSSASTHPQEEVTSKAQKWRASGTIASRNNRSYWTPILQISKKIILGLARPLLLFLNKMDADQGKIDPEDLAVTLEDTIYLILHSAAKVKVERRSKVAKEAKLPQEEPQKPMLRQQLRHQLQQYIEQPNKHQLESTQQIPRELEACIPPGGRTQHFAKEWEKRIGKSWSTMTIQEEALDKAVEEFLKDDVIEKASPKANGFLSNFFQSEKRQKYGHSWTYDGHDPTGRLPDQGRSEQCIPNNTGSPEEQTIPLVQTSRGDVLVQSDAVRSSFSSTQFLETNEGSQAKNQARLLIEHLQALGFIINEKKSEFKPKKQQIFLGFEINTETMDIKLPKEKVTQIRQDIKSTKTKPRTARQIASLAGLLASTAPAVRPAFIFQRHLQRDLAKHLQRTNQGWEKVIPLSKETIEDLKKWEILLDVHNGLQVRIPPPDETVNIMTDASGTGWGIVSTHLTTHGRWTDQERKTSSNQKELRCNNTDSRFGIRFKDSGVQDSRRTGRDSGDNPQLDDTTMDSTSPKSDYPTTSYPRSSTPELTKSTPTTPSTSNRMEIIRHAFETQRVLEKVIEIISKRERRYMREQLAYDRNVSYRNNTTRRYRTMSRGSSAPIHTSSTKDFNRLL
ncbi:uncharacterized protein VTP21DRAFT_8876 [Calcarisporiella thermophila]|uniref:uncharacterized protein n=1 Tax=Calcarisporiella thermophila TaxID=911321 RepID=UPI00374377B8